MYLADPSIECVPQLLQQQVLVCWDPCFHVSSSLDCRGSKSLLCTDELVPLPSFTRVFMISNGWMSDIMSDKSQLQLFFSLSWQSDQLIKVQTAPVVSVSSVTALGLCIMGCNSIIDQHQQHNMAALVSRTVWADVKLRQPSLFRFSVCVCESV